MTPIFVMSPNFRRHDLVTDAGPSSGIPVVPVRDGYLAVEFWSAQWNHDTSYMHLREEKKKCTKFSTYRVYDSCMTAVRDTCWPRKTYPRTYRPALALVLDFWRLAVDLLIALLIGTHRTQQFDQLPRGCPRLCYACMHAWQWQWIVTELASVSVFCFADKKISCPYSGCTQNVVPAEMRHMCPELHKEQIHPGQNLA